MAEVNPPEGLYTYVVGITVRLRGEMVREGSIPFGCDIHPADLRTLDVTNILTRLLVRMAAHEAEWDRVRNDPDARHDGPW